MDFLADVANIVITEIVIDADSGRGDKPEKKSGVHGESAGRKIEGALCVEVGNASENDHENCNQGSNPEDNCEPPHRVNFSIEKKHGENSEGAKHQPGLCKAESGNQVREVLDETDKAGGNFQRAAQDELPDK